jgi:hypothetical protein
MTTLSMCRKSHYFSTKKIPFFCGPHKYHSCGFHLDLGIPYLFQPWTSSRVTLSLSLYCAEYLKSHKLLIPHTLINQYICLAPTRLSLGFALDHWAQKQNNKGIPSRPTINLGATSHTSQEPWPWNCESPKESVQRPSQDTSKIM